MARPGFDDFEFRDDVMRANAKLTDDLRISLFKAARDCGPFTLALASR